MSVPFPYQNIEMPTKTVGTPRSGLGSWQEPRTAQELMQLAHEEMTSAIWFWQDERFKLSFENLGFGLAVHARVAKEYVNGAYFTDPEWLQKNAAEFTDITNEIAEVENLSDIYFEGAVYEYNIQAQLARIDAYWGSSEVVWDYIYSVAETVESVPEKVAEKVGNIIQSGLKGTGIDPSSIPYAYGLGAGLAVGIVALGTGWYFLARR